jgi:hypothetical protein
MKKVALYLCFLNIICNTKTFAQIDHGTFAHYEVGAVYNFVPRLQENLQASELVGKSVNMNGIGISHGGGIYFLTHSGVVVGASGYRYGLESSGQNGTTSFKLGGGIINIGYRTLKTKKMMGYPFIGVGAFGTKFAVTNTTANQSIVIGNYAIDPKKHATYSTGGFAFEAGYSLKVFAFNTDMHKKRKPRKEKTYLVGDNNVVLDKGNRIKKPRNIVGTTLGIDAGVSYNLAIDSWRNINYRDKIYSMKNPYIVYPFARLTLGVGIFAHTKRP